MPSRRYHRERAKEHGRKSLVIPHCVRHDKDPAVIQKTYDFYKDAKHGFDDSLLVRDVTLQAMLDYLAETTVPAARNAKPQQFYDMRLVNQLR